MLLMMFNKHCKVFGGQHLKVQIYFFYFGYIIDYFIPVVQLSVLEVKLIIILFIIMNCLFL